jgi:hypothetical protein
LLIGLLRADAGLTRYGLLVVAFLLGAILLIVAVDRLQAPAPEHA